MGLFSKKPAAAPIAEAPAPPRAVWDLALLLRRVHESAPALEARDIEAALVHARIADHGRDIGLFPADPAKVQKLTADLDVEGWRRLALAAAILDDVTLRAALSECQAIESGLIATARNIARGDGGAGPPERGAGGGIRASPGRGPGALDRRRDRRALAATTRGDRLQTTAGGGGAGDSRGPGPDGEAPQETGRTRPPSASREALACNEVHHRTLAKSNCWSPLPPAKHRRRRSVSLPVSHGRDAAPRRS